VIFCFILGSSKTSLCVYVHVFIAVYLLFLNGDFFDRMRQCKVIILIIWYDWVTKKNLLIIGAETPEIIKLRGKFYLITILVHYF